MSWKTHGKTIAIGLATVAMAAITIFRQVAVDGVTPSEWVMVVIAVASTANVWLTANLPSFSKAKTAVAAVFIVLNLLVSLIAGGISGDEWLLLAVNFLGALGVVAAPSVSVLAPVAPGGTTAAVYRS